MASISFQTIEGSQRSTGTQVQVLAQVQILGLGTGVKHSDIHIVTIDVPMLTTHRFEGSNIGHKLCCGRQLRNFTGRASRRAVIVRLLIELCGVPKAQEVSVQLGHIT